MKAKNMVSRMVKYPVIYYSHKPIKHKSSLEKTAINNSIAVFY